MYITEESVLERFYPLSTRTVMLDIQWIIQTNETDKTIPLQVDIFCSHPHLQYCSSVGDPSLLIHQWMEGNWRKSSSLTTTTLSSIQFYFHFFLQNVHNSNLFYRCMHRQPLEIAMGCRPIFHCSKFFIIATLMNYDTEIDGIFNCTLLQCYGFESVLSNLVVLTTIPPNVLFPSQWTFLSFLTTVIH